MLGGTDSDDEGSEEPLQEWELWHAAYDQAGRTYYYHEESGEVTWKRPECLGPDDGNGTAQMMDYICSKPD